MPPEAAKSRRSSSTLFTGNSLFFGPPSLVSPACLPSFLFACPQSSFLPWLIIKKTSSCLQIWLLLRNCLMPLSIHDRANRVCLCARLVKTTRIRLTPCHSGTDDKTRRGQAWLLSRPPSDCRRRFLSKRHSSSQRSLLQELHQAQLDRRRWQLQAAQQ